MAYEPKDNSGALFKNDRKEKVNHPDYQGDCLVNGKKMRIAGWIKTSTHGKNFMSLSFSEPREQQQNAGGNGPAPTDPGYTSGQYRKQSKGGGAQADLDDEIPF
jgi:hypothetical protein